MIIEVGDKVKFNTFNRDKTIKAEKVGYVQSCVGDVLDIIEENTHTHYCVYPEDARLIPGANFFKQTAKQIAKDKKRSAHYEKMSVQPLDVIKDWPIQQQIGALRFAALKYVMRLGNKDDGLIEAEKASDFVGWLIQVLKGEEIKNR